ncbi:hypothetical protein K503DRAFT_728834 [Rhizopogon vinicolor AM-OR11-026]|uniref:Nucleolus and neural progenitor protein-like N-terminal domain-containing protein n=1 Tax=Rhizopogon vinicolor AM-OR11-026 TaxID=1314800 RepID=A0A1B7NIG6_9AGAM|nr:hypothetical protein K503DRAFT_728834 [Rhizopogon vinicolor AM-OR11-026]
MNTRRSRAPPSISFSPRVSLDGSLHSTVDGILKDLKAYSRRLQAALVSYQDEIHVLERLYYKSKNQHRMALFFKRVSEIRRHGWRLLEVNISEHMQLLRASFYGATVVQSEKMMRGSWNHVPSQSYVSFIAERLRACSVLILRMSERVQEVYHHFALAMQTGAFIQLIVLFAGISSRMATLLTESGQCIRGCESVCDRLMIVLDPAHKAGFKARSRTSKALEPSLSHQSNQPAPTIDPDVSSEDIGSAVSRGAMFNLPFTPIDACAVEEPIVSIDIDHSVTLPSLAPLADPIASNQSEPPVVEKVTVNTLSTRKVKTVAKRKLPSTPATKGRSKKIKEKRDEIDDIFGF